jgi:SAM-dependent methyltransferase
MAAERWASGDAYEPYVGRWSRLVAHQFVAWLGVPPNKDWLDVGSGTGALCEVILANAAPSQVTGVDPSDGFVSFARHKVTDQRAAFQIGDAQKLPLADSSFDATVAGLVINFITDQPKAVSEMKRVTRALGVVGAYVWDYAGKMQMMRHFWDAAVAMDPSVGSITGPPAAIGNDMKNSFELGLDHHGRKLGGLPVEVIYADDQTKPEVGVQKTQELIESNHVDFVVGYIWSNVLLASLKPLVDSKTITVVTNAGASQFAGELCSPYAFSTSWQNDQTPAAVGLYMNQKEVKSAFLIGPNYAAGKDMLAGMQMTFKGQIVGQELTRWPDQLDFSAELSKARATKPRCNFCILSGRRRRAVCHTICAGRPEGTDSVVHRLYHRRSVAAALEGSGRRYPWRTGIGQ